MPAVEPGEDARGGAFHHRDPLPFPHMGVDVYVQWTRLCHDPAVLLHAQRRALAWLPPSTSQALLRELHSSSSSTTTTTTTTPAPPRRSSSAPPLPAHASRMTTQSAAAALAFLSLLLSPVLELMEATEGTHAVSAAQSNVLPKLELTTALLLRCLRHHCSPATVHTVGLAVAGDDASLSACARERAVAASLRLWLHFFLSFFLDQLHAERRRLAALRVTAAHLNRTRRLAKEAAKCEDKGTVAEATDTTTTQPPQAAEDEFVRKHPQLLKGRLLHSFAQKIRDSTNRILLSLSATSCAEERSLLETSSVSSRSACGSKSKPSQLQTKQRAGARWQRRPQMKRASRGPALRRPRRRRETSSDSTSSSDSSEASPSFSDASSDSDGDDDRGAGASGAATPLHESGSLADGDIPLAALAALLPPSH